MHVQLLKVSLELTYKQKIFLVGKAKKSSKKKRKDSSSLDAKGSTELHEDIDENDVYQISSGDDDSSKGMKSKNYGHKISFYINAAQCSCSMSKFVLVLSSY